MVNDEPCQGRRSTIPVVPAGARETASFVTHHFLLRGSRPIARKSMNEPVPEVMWNEPQNPQSPGARGGREGFSSGAREGLARDSRWRLEVDVLLLVATSALLAKARICSVQRFRAINFPLRRGERPTEHVEHSGSAPDVHWLRSVPINHKTYDLSELMT